MNTQISSLDSNRVFIIGNGFDLDLGWKVRYSDFALSEFWPKYAPVNSIVSYLERQCCINQWFDLEAELGKYASGNLSSNNQQQWISDTKSYFWELVHKFGLFLRDAIKQDIKTDCIAARVFAEILNNGNFSSIYSFNYTDLYEIASNLQLRKGFKYEHVHGSLKDNNIIIGAPEDADLKDGFEFLYKTFNEHYHSSRLIYDLREAKEIVFFGHSLGPTDYHYFRSLFQEQCRDGLERKDAKKITIFTYDDESRMSILKQLRKMNDNKTNLLYHHNDFKIIMTNKGNSQDLEEFIQHLRETSVDEFDQEVGRILTSRQSLEYF